MITTIDLSNIDYQDLPSWYKNIHRAVYHDHLTTGPDDFKETFVKVCGFDIEFGYAGLFIRRITGEESEIMMMILKWS